MTNTWRLKVPKILHVYWGGDILPYMRYLTVESFILLNPDWKVILWIPQHPCIKIRWGSKELDYPIKCEDYTYKLLSLPIEIRLIDCNIFGFDNDIHEVYKADLVRYYVLHNMGGASSDMDIIYFKPITDINVNTEENKQKDTFVCVGNYGHSNGLYMSAQGSTFFKTLSENAKLYYNPSLYQCLGPTFVNQMFPPTKILQDVSVANISMDTVYAYDFSKVSELFKDGSPCFTENSIGVHWYAGSHLWGDFINQTNGGLDNLPNNIIGNIIKQHQDGLDTRG